MTALPADAEWLRLGAEAVEGNPFFTPAILGPAAVALAGDGVDLVRVRDHDGSLAGLVPAQAIRLGRLVPARAVWTHLYAPLGTPLLRSAHAAPILTALDGGRDRILVFPFLPLDGPVGAALRVSAAKTLRPFAVIGLHERAALFAGDPDGGPSPRKQRELSRQLRRLEELGRVRFTTHSSVDEIYEAFEAFLALEAAGWKGTAGTAIALRAPDVAFARAAIAAAARAKMVEIDAIRLDGRMIAGLVSFIAGRRAVTWKIAYDETLGRFSPGAQLMLAAGRRLVAREDVDVVDSLAVSDHPMVDHLWRGRLAVGTLVIGPREGGALFRVGVALAEAELKARPLVRKLLSRLRR